MGVVGYPVGRPLSEEHKKAISNGLLNSPNRERLRTNLGKRFSLEHRKKISLSQIGKKRPKFSDEWISRLSEAAKGRKHTEEEKLKMSISNKGKKRSLETRMKVSEARSKQVFPKYDTLIERKVQDYLTKLNVDYRKHKVFKVGNTYHQVDAYIPSFNLAIECDGTYWHSKPGAKEHDEFLNNEISKQCDLTRLSEIDIMNGEFEGMLGQVFVS